METTEGDTTSTVKHIPFIPWRQRLNVGRLGHAIVVGHRRGSAQHHVAQARFAHIRTSRRNFTLSIPGDINHINPQQIATKKTRTRRTWIWKILSKLFSFLYQSWLLFTFQRFQQNLWTPKERRWYAVKRSTRVCVKSTSPSMKMYLQKTRGLRLRRTFIQCDELGAAKVNWLYLSIYNESNVRYVSSSLQAIYSFKDFWVCGFRWLTGMVAGS